VAGATARFFTTKCVAFLKLLVYGINFSPELTGIGKYTGDLAVWLAGRGHEVRVVTAPPYYPDWKVGAGYSAKRWSCNTWQGVQVWRCPLWVPTRPGGVARLLHLASFALSSLPVVLRHAFWRPDVVWVVAPSLLCAPTGLAVARLVRARAWLHIQDFEVDAAFGMGLLTGNGLRRTVLGAERWLLARFDRVSTISPRMVERLHAKGVVPARQVLFPNWVEMQNFDSPAAPSRAGAQDYRVQLGIPSGAIVALYSGNMGAKQGLEVLADVAASLAGNPAVWFVFCGNGVGRAELLARCANLPQVRFLDLQPAQRLPELLGMADIHLLPQRADAADLVMPSKLTGMLASARPVVAGAGPETGLAEVVQHCGMVVPPEDAAAFTEAIELLANDATLRNNLGAAGHSYALQHMERTKVLERFERALLDLTEPC
jgi:colanic acid biosynthesis glycosyl transferase WcaI